MITAQDIREKTFEKSTFGGYAMNEVDDFLDELANDLGASQKEADTLRAKMKVLAKEIKEYRDSEDAMHLALVSAQKVAKSVEAESRAKAESLVAEAQAKADAILADAQARADAIVGSIENQRKAEELRLQKAQSAASEYIQKFRMVLDHETAFLDSLKDSDLVRDIIVTPAPPEKPAIPAPVGEPEEAPAEAEAEAAEPAAAPEEETVPEYVSAFEKAVEKAVFEFDDTIPSAGEGDEAPAIRF